MRRERRFSALVSTRTSPAPMSPAATPWLSTAGCAFYLKHRQS